MFAMQITPTHTESAIDFKLQLCEDYESSLINFMLTISVEMRLGRCQWFHVVKDMVTAQCELQPQSVTCDGSD
jgi:hypothetical protein